jgi:hypothetical protein
MTRGQGPSGSREAADSSRVHCAAEMATDQRALHRVQRQNTRGLLDAFVVRTLLVPALVALMGRWNWWMPAGLTRLLRVRPPELAEQRD